MSAGTFELTHRQVMLVFSGLMLGIFLAAVDGTIVTTALPTIAGELGGLGQLPWVLTAYFLTSTIATPLLGKLSDLYGRRIVFQGAIVLFLVGSVAAGLSQTMTQLVILRGVQGIGGGGLQAIGFIILGDILSPRDRAKYMGMFTAVFALAGLIGPLLGGFFVDNLDWRWIFYINLPLGIVALAMTHKVLQLPFPRREHSIDYLGATLFIIAITSLLLATVWGDSSGWLSGQVLGLIALSIVGTVAFVWWEHRAAEPILPMHIFRNKVIPPAMAASFLAGAVIMGANAFLPLFLQVVTRISATRSGLLLTPLMAGLTLMSVISGRLLSRGLPYKRMMAVGATVMAFGVASLLVLDSSTSAASIIPLMIVIGLGAGTMWPVLSVATQNGLPVEDLGSGTAAYTFFRTLGQTLSLALYGAVLNSAIRSELPRQLPADSPPDLDVDALLGSPSQIDSLTAGVATAVREAVSFGVNRVFIAVVPVAVLMVVAVLLIPEVPLRQSSGIAERQAGADGDASETTEAAT